MKIFQPGALFFMLLGVASNAQAADALTVTGDAVGTVVEVEDRLSIRKGPKISAISADSAMAAADDASIPTTAAVKSYVDAAVVAEALVHVEASSDAGQPVSASSLFQYEDEAIDTHGAWGLHTFTAPRAGIYLVMAHTYNSGMAELAVVKNGVTHTWGAATHYGKAVEVVLQLNVGDTLSIRTSKNYVRQGGSDHNRLTVTEIR